MNEKHTKKIKLNQKTNSKKGGKEMEKLEQEEKPEVEAVLEESVSQEEQEAKAESAEQGEAEAAAETKPGGDRPEGMPEIPKRLTAAEVEALTAEAEMRGYLRGRNESIEELMKRPGTNEPLKLAPNPERPAAGGGAEILRTMRESIWKRGGGS